MNDTPHLGKYKLTVTFFFKKNIPLIKTKVYIYTNFKGEFQETFEIVVS